MSVVLPFPNGPITLPILRNIRAAIDGDRCRERCKLSLFAKQEFARLNGWKITDDAFSPDKIGTYGDVHYRRDGIFDHCLYFRERGRAAAIANQPYGHVTEAAARAVGTSYGLATHIAPSPRTSIYYPGVCKFIVYTRQGVTVRWLPEQVFGLAVQP